jgi:Tfp pilus assembly protein PilX
MIRPRFVSMILGALLVLGLFGSALAQQPPAKCGPDHAILYKRAVKLLDNAEKKLAAGYTAEAKSKAKEANSLFTILHKECGPQQAERALTDQEIQQEAINQKLSADELAQAERLTKSAEEKTQKAAKIETTQPELYLKYQREAKAEFEQAHKRSIKSEIYALRNQQMVFSFLGR